MYNPYYYNPVYQNRMMYIPPHRTGGMFYPRLSTPITKASTFKLSSILETTQKGINTINQIIPLYNQVKPIVTKVNSWGKNITNYVSQVSKKGFMRGDTIIENEPIKQSQPKTTYTQDKTNYEQNKPSSPFYK